MQNCEAVCIRKEEAEADFEQKSSHERKRAAFLFEHRTSKPLLEIRRAGSIKRNGGNNLIEVSHLVKQYGTQAAVDDLSFTVERGQIYGFLGPNGAGKSTTMNILTGYLAPTFGEVKIGGHNILEEPEAARRCIGYLPEIPPVYPEMTVLEYLNFAAGLKKLPSKERNKYVAEAMEMTGLIEMQNRLIRNLSKGFRQRVGLAQAILGFPEIIILDEPMVGLDPKQIIEIRELIRELGKKHTVILSSHILSEISAICDQIMIISHGKLVANDTPGHLIELMQGSGQLELTVKGSVSAVRRSFENSTSNPSWKARITELQVKEAQEEGAVDVTIQTDVSEDLREAIFYHCAQNGMPILRMQQSQVSLEDVFLELTESEQSENVSNGQTEDDVQTSSKGWKVRMKRSETKKEGGDEDAGNL